MINWKIFASPKAKGIAGCLVGLLASGIEILRSLSEAGNTASVGALHFAGKTMLQSSDSRVISAHNAIVGGGLEMAAGLIGLLDFYMTHPLPLLPFGYALWQFLKHHQELRHHLATKIEAAEVSVSNEPDAV